MLIILTWFEIIEDMFMFLVKSINMLVPVNSLPFRSHPLAKVGVFLE